MKTAETLHLNIMLLKCIFIMYEQTYFVISIKHLEKLSLVPHKDFMASIFSEPEVMNM